MKRILIAILWMLVSQCVSAEDILKLELTEELEMHGGPDGVSSITVKLESRVVTNPLSPLSDPSNGTPKRPTPKANS